MGWLCLTPSLTLPKTTPGTASPLPRLHTLGRSFFSAGTPIQAGAQPALPCPLRQQGGMAGSLPMIVKSSQLPGEAGKGRPGSFPSTGIIMASYTVVAIYLLVRWCWRRTLTSSFPFIRIIMASYTAVAIYFPSCFMEH